MLGRIAKLYYEHDYTHQQIADLIGWSRIKVTRALAEARENGIVEITVHTDEHVFVGEEVQLTERFDLTQAWVSPPVVNDNSDPLAVMGAHAVEQLVGADDQISVGLSATLAAVASHITPKKQINTVFVPLNGTNFGHVDKSAPSNIAASFAASYGGTAHNLAAPMFTGSADMHEIMRKDARLRAAFETACKSDIALVGIGGMTPDTSLILQSDLTPSDVDELRNAGAIGDINARFFNEHGAPVETARTALVLGPSLDDLSGIPIRVAVAAGPRKVDAIAAAIRGNLITHLVTDLSTATQILQR